MLNPILISSSYVIYCQGFLTNVVVSNILAYSKNRHESATIHLIICRLYQ